MSSDPCKSGPVMTSEDTVGCGRGHEEPIERMVHLYPWQICLCMAMMFTAGGLIGAAVVWFASAISGIC